MRFTFNTEFAGEKVWFVASKTNVRVVAVFIVMLSSVVPSLLSIEPMAFCNPSSNVGECIIFSHLRLSEKHIGIDIDLNETKSERWWSQLISLSLISNFDLDQYEELPMILKLIAVPLTVRIRESYTVVVVGLYSRRRNLS